MIPLEKIRISAFNMRINEPFGNEKEDQELIENIKSQGIIHPIIVRQIGDIYAVDIGRRRFLGAKAAGLEEISCIVTEMTDDEAMDASFSENIIRKDVDPVTQGWWIVGKLER
ncbi:MAG: ParB N-terminal domain-containing protein, partial [Thermoplasmata archaeon]|nr:ParB N-terminal domain-containing protein [Thermoplasmata archaeon]